VDRPLLSMLKKVVGRVDRPLSSMLKKSRARGSAALKQESCRSCVRACGSTALKQ
jgi:hypothetical protein